MSNTTLITESLLFVVLIISIQEMRDNPRQFVQNACTGTLIREDLVLTAAHCFRNKSLHDPKEVTIVLLSGVVRKSHEIFVHPNFSRDGYDLAVVTHGSVGNIKFPSMPITDLQTNKSCFAAGFGDSQTLRVFPVDLAESYRGRAYTYFFVLFLEGSPCHGDSGGPLICGGTICGVLTQGTVKTCFEKAGIILYEDLFLHLNWIKRFFDMPIIPYNQGKLRWLIYIFVAIILTLMILACVLIILVK